MNKKPRIVVVDTDINYIFALETKFVEEFFGKVDIEIITDANYYRSLFESPQNIDIMIVCEKMYDTNLLKHNIENIFVMTEQDGDSYTAQLSANLMYKYTNIKEIFNKIVGISADSLKLEKIEQESKLVMFYSANGGTGKTSIALAISEALSKNYKKVLYINASYLQSFASHFKEMTPILSRELYTNFPLDSQDLYSELKAQIKKEQFSYLPPFKAAIISLDIDFSVYAKLAESAKKSDEYDYIILDVDSGFDDEKAKLMELCDKVIIVSEQSAASVYATNLLVSNISKVNTDKFSFICNKYSKEKEKDLILSNIKMKYEVSENLEFISNFECSTYKDIPRNSIEKVIVSVL